MGHDAVPNPRPYPSGRAKKQRNCNSLRQGTSPPILRLSLLFQYLMRERVGSRSSSLTRVKCAPKRVLRPYRVPRPFAPRRRSQRLYVNSNSYRGSHAENTAAFLLQVGNDRTARLPKSDAFFRRKSDNFNRIYGATLVPAALVIACCDENLQMTQDGIPPLCRVTKRGRCRRLHAPPDHSCVAKRRSKPGYRREGCQDPSPLFATAYRRSSVDHSAFWQNEPNVF
jgi:hypothetical protein